MQAQEQFPEAVRYIHSNPEVAAALVERDRERMRPVEFDATDADGQPVRKVFAVRDGSSDIPELVHKLKLTGNRNIAFRPYHPKDAA